jgi:hypothetical protein
MSIEQYYSQPELTRESLNSRDGAFYSAVSTLSKDNSEFKFMVDRIFQYGSSSASHETNALIQLQKLVEGYVHVREQKPVVDEKAMTGDVITSEGRVVPHQKGSSRWGKISRGLMSAGLASTMLLTACTGWGRSETTVTAAPKPKVETAADNGFKPDVAGNIKPEELKKWEDKLTDGVPPFMGYTFKDRKSEKFFSVRGKAEALGVDAMAVLGVSQNLYNRNEVPAEVKDTLKKMIDEHRPFDPKKGEDLKLKQVLREVAYFNEYGTTIEDLMRMMVDETYRAYDIKPGDVNDPFEYKKDAAGKIVDITFNAEIAEANGIKLQIPNKAVIPGPDTGYTK